ncbi:MAG: outer membrane protein [Micavibrio sp.]|nr:outer membrane protein [Micavibrio sp.]
MKKILMSALLSGAACLLLIAAAPAHAADSYYNTDVARDGSFNGPYLGGTVNYNWTNGEATRTGVGSTDNIDMNGAEGGVLVGYGWQFDPSFLSSIWSGYTALELSYDWNGSNNDTALGTNFNKDESMMLSLRPGFTWGNQALGYGILGYSRGQFSVGGDEKWLDGYSLGLGTELAVVGPFKTRIEYVYTNYSEDNFNTGTNTNFNPHDNALKLGAVFHF